jgi:DNA-binding HxlR family transcriptional regulator
MWRGLPSKLRPYAAEEERRALAKIAQRPDETEFRSGCPIASTLEVIGDRWTLVILRDLVNGKSRFAEFLDGPERIATNILTARLAQMEAHGLVRAELYERRPKRYAYALTEKGAALLPLLQDMCRWGQAHLEDRWTAPASFMRKKPGDLV